MKKFKKYFLVVIIVLLLFSLICCKQDDIEKAKRAIIKYYQDDYKSISEDFIELIPSYIETDTYKFHVYTDEINELIYVNKNDNKYSVTAKSPDPEIIEIQIGNSVDKQIIISPINKKMPLDFATENYVTNKIIPICNYSPYWYNAFFNYNYTFENHDYYECYIFDIDGYDNLKLYAYFTKSICYKQDKSESVLIQTILVDESKKSSNIEFNIGDNIEYVKKHYPDVNILFSSYLSDGGKYFEICNENGIYSYFLDDNNIIQSKEKIDIVELTDFYTQYPYTFNFESKYKLFCEKGKYSLKKIAEHYPCGFQQGKSTLIDK